MSAAPVQSVEIQIKSNSLSVTEPVAAFAYGATVPSVIVTVREESTPFTFSVALYGPAPDDSRMLKTIDVATHAFGTTTVQR